MQFNGMPVIFNQWLTEPRTTEAKRTWRERLWSWPWRPWQRTKFVTVQVPSQHVYQTQDRLLMHPDLWEQIQRASPEGAQR